MRFAYGQEVIDTALAAGQAISYRFVRRDGAWCVHATTERAPAPVMTHRLAGAVGVDLNTGLVAVAEVDRFGNPVASRHVPVRIQGRREEQVRAALGDAAADVVAWAKAAGKPVVVERLDFRGKKARLREVSDRHARQLSHFAYGTFHAMTVSRAQREGVEVIAVNPAFTSVIGKRPLKRPNGLASACSRSFGRRWRKSERGKGRGSVPLRAHRPPAQSPRPVSRPSLPTSIPLRGPARRAGRAPHALTPSR